MRTTLEIDDRVLAVARERARREGVSLGRAVSDLALRGAGGGDLGCEQAGRAAFHAAGRRIRTGGDAGDGGEVSRWRGVTPRCGSSTPMF